MPMDEYIYLKCDDCHGTGRVSNGGEDPQGRRCEACENACGFKRMNLTIRQVQRAIQEAAYYYNADGSYEVINDWDRVKAMRIAAAKELVRLKNRVDDLEADEEARMDNQS